MTRTGICASQMAIASLMLFASTAVRAEDAKEEAKWDVSAPPGMKTSELPISVDEGTWMNIDVSPDGRQLAFDLLGDIYTMPITGGTPTRIAQGLAYETQPRFSPDGASPSPLTGAVATISGS
jgi:WD40-like Beta Propeller Repeat